ncbi:DNA-directed RNA polymerase [Chytriomyces confervae]|uniref:DNA-directed RNA polymerase n=1 Tax=Chytriomyces confervae TaxID=246404 RepID=A0A507FET2_9FUNG|nr:DNA-directed RNA polymerase [Chytriomyces confervae]
MYRIAIATGRTTGRTSRSMAHAQSRHSIPACCFGNMRRMGTGPSPLEEWSSLLDASKSGNATNTASVKPSDVVAEFDSLFASQRTSTQSSKQAKAEEQAPAQPPVDPLAAALFPRTASAANTTPVKPTTLHASQFSSAMDQHPSTIKTTANSIAPQDAAHFLSERFALIYACLATGDIRRAEVLFNRTVRVFQMSFGQGANGESIGGGFVLERGMVNAFVEAHLHTLPTPNFQKALEWHVRAVREFALPYDVSTYAALIHHTLIVSNNMSAATKLVLEMKNIAKLDPSELMGDRRFAEPENLATLRALLRGIDASFIVGNEDDAKITQMVLEASMRSNVQSRNGNASVGSNSVAPNDSLLLAALKDNAESSEETVPIPSVEPTVEEPKLSDLRETNSMGVKILRKTLANLSHNLNGAVNMTAKSFEEKLKLQMELEEKALSAAAEEMHASHEKLPDNLKSILQLPGRHTVDWNRELVSAIRNEIAALEADTADADQHGHVPFLKLLTPEQLSRITITEFLRIDHKSNSNEPGGGGVGEGGTVIVDNGASQAVATVSILSRIGTSIETEHNLQQIQKKKNQKLIDTNAGIHSLHMNGRLFNATMRKVITKLAAEEADKDAKDNWIPKWPITTKVRAGSVLAILLMRIAKVQVPHADLMNPLRDVMMEEPAFQHGYANMKGRKFGVIKMHPLILEQMALDPIHVHPRLLPMVVPPRPWLSRNSGGYVNYKSDVLRTRSNEHMAYLAAADERQHLSGVYESLDVLGKTAWRVNERVYEVVKRVWNSGEALAEFPPVLEDELGRRSSRSKRPDDWETMTPEAKKAWAIELQKQEASRRNNFSQRCDINYKIEIARSFIGQTIYFPHNMDFRGRAYPMPAHLNHMGNDFCRGLLMFDQKKRLGARGLKWLKIQVANLMGNNKISFDARAKFAEDHIEDIMDSADKPLDGKRWWLTAEDPWQMLATCFELTDAMRSANPIEFLSCIPVHQDGTCNGLQHYAALGGDKLGAAQVNLMPSEKPGDIYSGVADRVSAAIDKLAETGCELSLLMKGKITRKLVKQTVMTNTYGVTFIGARDQVRSRLKEQPELYPFTDEQIQKCSLHITHLIFDSLGELFSGARALQNWLNSTASMIAKSIPAAAIPEIQLEDAAFLHKIGCLPSAFTVARAQVKETESKERSHEDKLDKKAGEAEVVSSMDEMYDSLMDAVLDDEAKSTEMKEYDEDLFDFSGDMEASVEAESAIAAVNSAAAVANSKKKVDKMASVIWTTPLGLPIVQPYRQHKTRSVSTMLQTVTIRDSAAVTPVNPMKQSTAFPPNFIHSLDATHMMLSAIACNQAGIDFASVHDSYWTHACDIDTMSSTLRDTFVTLHSKDIMNNLQKELQERNATHKYPVTVEVSDPEMLQKWAQHLTDTGRAGTAQRMKKAVKKKILTWVDLAIPPLPAKGDFDLNLVKQSPYFFH